MTCILVFGWYNNFNIGDNLFIEAYQHLFPDFEFIFTESIDVYKLKDVKTVFFGGGSFLLDDPNIAPKALKILKNKKIFYIGIGVEANIHPVHLDLMSRAVLIATRSPDQLERLKLINPNIRIIPDLVYALQPKVKLSQKINRSVLIMPNIIVVPQGIDPQWKHAAWAYFKSEFTQFLDWLVDNDYHPSFFSMCSGKEMDDEWASSELIGHMKNRDRNYLLRSLSADIAAATYLVSRYETVITQRFHGIVLSEMTRTPYIAIHHHDKLKCSKPNEGIFLSYYNSSKQSFIDAFNRAKVMNYVNVLPIDYHMFEGLVEEIKYLI